MADLLRAEEALARNPSTVEEGLVSPTGVAEQGVPANQLDGAAETVAGQINAPSSIGRSLPRESPLIEFADDISDNEAVEYRVLVEFDGSPFDVPHITSLQPPHIALNL